PQARAVRRPLAGRAAGAEHLRDLWVADHAGRQAGANPGNRAEPDGIRLRGVAPDVPRVLQSVDRRTASRRRPAGSRGTAPGFRLAEYGLIPGSGIDPGPRPLAAHPARGE